MNIGNSYASWMHNTAQSGYGNRSGQTGKTETAKTFAEEDNKNDADVTNEADAEKKQTEEKDEEKKAEDMTLREQILAHMEEMAKKVREGKVEPTFQTGAQTFTIKEWDKLLADFDDAEEALQELVKEQIMEAEKQAAREAARREAEGKPDSVGTGTVVTNVSVPTAALPNAEAGGSVANPNTEATGSVTGPAVSVADTATKPAKSGAASSGIKPWELDGMDDNVTDVEVTDPEELADLLTGQATKCSYPTDDPKNKHWFITCYGQDGIMCREAYMENGKWVNRTCWNLPYTEPGQREKVLAFIQRFPQDASLRFASHENFWKDFLAGEIDEDDFVNFFETSTDKNGVPDYTYEKDGSTYIDREKAKYAKYMNDFGAHFYTGEEMELLWRAIINENRKGLKKISDYDGQMTIPGSDEAGRSGKKENAGEEEDDLETQIITKPDGSTVLEIKTSFGVMEVEITEAQKFGLQYNPRPGAETGRMRGTNPFARGAGAAAYEAAGL